MNKSKCKVCGSAHTIKYGTRNGVQTYRCADCGYRFRNGRLPSDREIWRLYQENKQTAAELAVMLGTSPSTIKRRLRNITITWGQPDISGSGFVHLDATYWGRNNGIMVGLDSGTGNVLYLEFIRHERLSDYQAAVASIESRGYRITGIIIDGLQGLFRMFSAYRMQMCQFHMIQIVRRYITQNPKLLAARALNDLMKGLATADGECFAAEYESWKAEWKDTLNKRSVLKDGKTRFRHRRLRSAMHSIDFYLPYLFAYQREDCQGMPNTNNRIEGTFTDLKKNLNNHSGMSIENRRRFITGFFLALEGNPACQK